MTLVTSRVDSVTSTSFRVSFGDMRTVFRADVAGLVRNLAGPKLHDQRLVGLDHSCRSQTPTEGIAGPLPFVAWSSPCCIPTREQRGHVNSGSR